MKQMPEFDVFLSHNSADKPAVEDLAQRLQKEGLRPFLDKWHLVPGEPWQEALEHAVDASRAVAVFVGPSGVSPWENEEMRWALERRVQDLSRRVIPVLLPGAPDPGDRPLPSALRRLTWVDFRGGLNDPRALHGLVCGIRGLPPGLTTPDVTVAQVVQRAARPTPDAGTLAIPHLPEPYFASRYSLEANFAGRYAERQALTQWLVHGQEPVLCVVAMGGMGKSSLVWYWMQEDADLDPLDGVFWWSFDQTEASFAAFLNEALRYASDHTLDPNRLSTAYDRVRALLRLLQESRLLIVLDSFEHQLAAYVRGSADQSLERATAQDTDARRCVDPYVAQFLTDLAAGPTQSKAIVTTRLMVRDLEGPDGEPLRGCRRQALASLSPQDAVVFMRAQGVTKGTDAEIAAACRPYDCHPLSLRLLSGLVKQDKQTPGDIATVRRYQDHGSLVRARSDVLETAYRALPGPLQRLLSKLAAFRGAVSYDALAVLNEFGDREAFEAALEELCRQGLLLFDPHQVRFDLHPIVRAFAYNRLADPRAVHAQLCDYFETLPAPAAVHSIQDLAPLIEVYHHRVRSGRFDDAWYFYDQRLRRPLYYTLCAYEADAQLLQMLLGGTQAPPQVQGSVAQTWVLIYASMCYERMGQLSEALSLASRAANLNRGGGREADLGSALVALASVQALLGQLQAARKNGLEAATIMDRLGDANWRGISHRNYGHTLISCGGWTEANHQLDLAEKSYQTNPSRYTHGLSALTLHRAELAFVQGDLARAGEMARRAHETAREGNYTRESIDARYWQACIQHRTGRLDAARASLEAILTECRRTRFLELEVDVLLVLAQVYRGLSASDAEYRPRATAFVQQALAMADRCGFRLKQASIHVCLARWWAQDGDSGRALHHAQLARERAWCDGPPNAAQPALSQALALLGELSTGHPVRPQ